MLICENYYGVSCFAAMMLTYVCRNLYREFWMAYTFTYCGPVMLLIWVNIDSGTGLLPDGTKPLPEPMLTYHH